MKSSGSLVVRGRLRGRRAPSSKPDSTEDPPCLWACCEINHKCNDVEVRVITSFGMGRVLAGDGHYLSGLSSRAIAATAIQVIWMLRQYRGNFV
ncbi:hypothetical protein AVEN_102910-1 [Araneus ventricosus]|uniref:Uncharacterized protein n=1 Tax=Araneus ventricosus TaxID=182803 RepID=A0A4Y2HZI8_ARAVE|nr:hypothetical protein AVEN_102910-1 [Araneus ventricosus]